MDAGIVEPNSTLGIGALAPGTPLPLGTFLAEFELVDFVSQGGFGIVYLCMDHLLQRRVALKEYLPSTLAGRTGTLTVGSLSPDSEELFRKGLGSFINEARLLAQFDHASLVKVHRFWEANGTAYMVMPYYEGPTLKKVLAGMPQPPDEAWLLGLLEPLTEALATIHAQHCYHRDIAPDNIILSAGSGHPVLLDFGAARRVISDAQQVLTVILKPGYAPVEQYDEVADSRQGPWTDIYALGAVLHFAITGRKPPAAVTRLLSDRLVPLAQSCADRYRVEFLQAIDRALAVKAEDRFQTIDAFRQALGLAALPPSVTRGIAPAARADPFSGRGDTTRYPTAAGGTRTGPAPAASPRSPTRAAGGPGRSTPAIGVAAGVLAIALGGGVWWWTQRAGPAPVVTPPTAAAAPPVVVAAPPSVVAAPPAVDARTGTAPVTPAAPAAPSPLDTDQAFQRIVADQTPGWSLDARLAQAQFSIAREDTLALSVTAAREGHVYVYLRSPDGEVIQYAPSRRSAETRIGAGQTMTVPRPGARGLRPTRPAGSAEALVIVSKSPRRLAAQGDWVADDYRSLPGGQAARAWLAGHGASVAALYLGEAVCAQPPCAQEYAAAVLSFAIVD